MKVKEDLKKKKKKKTGQVPGFCQRAEKVMEHKGDSDSNKSWDPEDSKPEHRKEETRWTGD